MHLMYITYNICLIKLILCCQKVWYHLISVSKRVDLYGKTPYLSCFLVRRATCNSFIILNTTWVFSTKLGIQNSCNNQMCKHLFMTSLKLDRYIVTR